MTERRIRRREALLTGVGAAAGTLVVSDGLAEAGARTQRRRARMYDVVVVGAGLAGLSAATAIRKAGRSVVVLEARRRVGGRSLDHVLGPGKVVELGGEWTGPGQDRVHALARSLGVATFPTYSTGNSVYYSGGQLHTYSGDIPPASPGALIELETATVAFNRMAASVPADAPWTAPLASAWDQLTIQTWIEQNLESAEARNLAGLGVRGVYGEDADEISLLDLLAAITGVGGDFNTLIGSAQSVRFVGGPQQLSERLAARLGHRVRLGVEVTAVEQGGHVTVHSETESFRCRRAILTLPKTLVGRLRFAPALPPALDQVLQRQPMGSVLKVNAIYKRPFWRDTGLNGSATSEVGPIRITYDNSPPDGRPGVLVGFMEGSDSRGFYGASPAARRAAALRCFARYFGPRALSPVAYFDVMWATEPFSRGAYGSFNPPGVLTALNNPLDTPFGAVHYASADNSPQWPGYMDGAIRSGEQAAARVLAEL
jgi:monoamine oxidase